MTAYFIIICLLVSIIATWLFIKLAWKINFLSHPNPIVQSHKKPVAYLGGGAILMAIILNSWIAAYLLPDAFFNQELLYIILSCAGLFLIGVIDDYYRLSPAIKFAMQIVVAIGIVSMGFTVDIFSVYFLNALLSGFILLSMLNAFNLIDVCDGLLTIVFLPALVFFYIVFGYGFFELLLMMTLLGFLIFNRPDARIYLGDAGSHLLGGLAYIYLSKFINASSFFTDTLIIALLFSVIIFEFMLLLYRRTKKGISIFRGSPDHFSILLTKAGWKKEKIVLTAFSISCITGFLALVSYQFGFSATLFSFCLYLVFSFFIGYKINKTDRPHKL